MKPTLMLIATIDESGAAEVRRAGRKLTPGIAGLALAKLAANYCAQNPATAEDRQWFEAMEYHP